jgi:hypothetical protein
VFSSPSVEQIDVVTFALDSEVFVDQLCFAASSQDNIRLRIAIRKNGWSAGIDRLKQCLSRSGFDLNRLTVKYWGSTGDLGAFHLKIITTRSSDGSGNVVFGSGNPSGGVQTFFDNWNFYAGQKDDLLLAQHQCITDAIFRSQEPSDLNSFNAAFSPCFLGEPMPTIDFKLLPLHREEVLQQLRALAVSSETISIAIHKVGDSRIRDIIAEGLAKGAAVRILMDDDVYWSGDINVGWNTSAEFRMWNKRLGELGASIRYMQTNHHFSDSMHAFHHKFIVFKLRDGNQVTFTGGANFTSAAYSSKRIMNYENVYFLRLNEASNTYQARFDYYWSNLSAPSEMMPNRDDHDFLELIPGQKTRRRISK